METLLTIVLTFISSILVFVWIMRHEINPRELEGFKKLKSTHPDLAESYKKMDREDLLNQICLEVIDLQNMEERVQLFMNECTMHMSKTNYTIGSLKSMIQDKKEHEIMEFCIDLISDNDTDEEVLVELYKVANQEKSKS